MNFIVLGFMALAFLGILALGALPETGGKPANGMDPAAPGASAPAAGGEPPATAPTP
ncbi:hypothetical protein [Sphingomonas prati]|uniref:Uncharacterized protein n=1 Tax=Sphingomonas prati TaxID=1843237 RepID=A0A7W9F2C7_9SPHN|nr:hypothetical protein [Sphingomonas prati]MBB5730248.1 hypothetical protein [Sphingomonas prati]